VEGNIKVIFERQVVTFFTHDYEPQGSVKGRKFDRVTIRFSNRALSHRVAVIGAYLPSFITIVNLVKYLANDVAIIHHTKS
jgi:hypothetical protein